jgi:GT2 family glycosyltransferase
VSSSPAHDLAIILVSTNEKRWLGPCLSTLYAHAGTANVEVIVVDNQSTDGTREFVESAFPQARVVTSQNAGFAHANNRGWECANARYALFLNPDTRVIEGTFGELIDALDSRPEVGLAGVRHVSPEGQLYSTMRRFPSASRTFGEALWSERWPVHPSWSGERVLDLDLHNREAECDWTVGAFMLARREALLSAGMMDERLFLQCEEADLCLRIKRAGWSVRHLPMMSIIHHAQKGGRKARMAAQETYARRQYAQKHFAAAHRAFYLSAIGARHGLRAIGTGGSEDAQARRRAARSALRTLVRPSEPPFTRPPLTALRLETPAGLARKLGPAVPSALEMEPRARAAELGPAGDVREAVALPTSASQP